MKNLTTKILACGAILAGLCQTQALELRLSTDNGASWTNIVDNGPADSNPTLGLISYSGTLNGFTVGADSGDNVTGDPTNPYLDLSTINFSQQPATLIAELSDTSFTPFNNQTFITSTFGRTTGTTYFSAFRDPSNILYGENQTLFALGPFTGANYSSSNAVVVAAGGNAPYSLTLQMTIIHTGAGDTETDTSLYTLPAPQCNCSVTFNGPLSITNCAGDKIPAVTATQDCGNGPVSVPVVIAGAVTNGSCPSIITLTNAAVDACGNVQTFVQTITVNCRGSVCGHIFADCDGSGDLTAGDVGLSNVVVTLISSNNAVLGTHKTDANGGYCFTNLPGAIYTVQVTAPSGYSQTAGSTSYHWKDNYGRVCWGENDGYIHCLSSGTECWWDKSNYCHWKDSYGRDCWKDKYNNSHCQPCSYQSCNTTSYNNKLTVTLTNCTSLTDVDFAYTGSKAGVSCTVTAPSYVKCGQTCTYTCTVVNNGNVCFTGGKVCHTYGNCNNWGWGNGCTTVTDNCPPLSPGQSCTFTHKCTYSSWNCGTVGCQSTVTCYQGNGNNCSQSSSCYSSCGW